MAPDRRTPPQISNFKNIRLDIPEPVILSNGMKMWIAGNGEDDINKLCIYLNGGAFQESRPVQATTCSLAIFSGNKFMNHNEIAEAIDYYGAWRAAQVNDNTTAISISSLNEYFNNTLPILCDSMRFPVFPDSELEITKRQLAVNCATARERVKYIANKEMMRLYYGNGHPLAIDPTPQDIESLTRDDMVAFHNAYYKAENCNIVLAGHITDKEIDTIERVVGDWKPLGAPAQVIEPEATPSGDTFRIVHKAGAVQSAITMTIRAIPRRHPDYFKLRILTTVLGGYFGSRLMSNIREDKGYTYGINSILSGRAFDGYIAISTECDTKHTWNVIRETKNEITRLCHEPIPQHELDIVKRYMMSDMAKTLDTPFNIAAYIGNMFCYGIYPTYFNEHVDAILSVNSQQLLETAQKYLNPDNLLTVIACDKTTLPSEPSTVLKGR